MTDPGPRARARRPRLAPTVLKLAAVAATAATLVWSGLFYDATRKHLAAAAGGAAAPPAQVAAARGTQTAQPAAPLVTRAS